MPSQRVPIPSAEIRAQIGTSLEALVRALEAHPLWTPPTPPPGIFYVWDFANRSKYINSEIDNVLAGKDVKHPDQFSKDTRGQQQHTAVISCSADDRRSGPPYVRRAGLWGRHLAERHGHHAGAEPGYADVVWRVAG